MKQWPGKRLPNALLQDAGVLYRDASRELLTAETCRIEVRWTMLDPKEIRTDFGRCEVGSFVRVVHVPSGESCERGPIGELPPEQVQAELLLELERLLDKDESGSEEAT